MAINADRTRESRNMHNKQPLMIPVRAESRLSCRQISPRSHADSLGYKDFNFTLFLERDNFTC